VGEGKGWEGGRGRKGRGGKEGREGIVSPSPAPSFKILKPPLGSIKIIDDGTVQ